MKLILALLIILVFQLGFNFCAWCRINRLEDMIYDLKFDMEKDNAQ